MDTIKFDSMSMGKGLLTLYVAENSSIVRIVSVEGAFCLLRELLSLKLKDI